MRYINIQAVRNGHSDCGACNVRSTALFADIGDDAIPHIQSQIDELSLKPRGVLYHMGAQADAVFTLRTGAVKLVRYSPTGQHRIVRVLKPGDLIGLEALASGTYGNTAVALSAVTLCRLPIALIERMEREVPEVRRRLLEKWHDALDRADAWLAELACGQAPARARMARLMLHMRMGVASRNGEQRVVRMSLEDYAAALGITIETASRTLASWQREGVLVKQRGDRYTYKANTRRLMQEAGEEELAA